MAPPTADYLVLEGKAFQSDHGRHIRVLCGDEPPTVTAGYAIWGVIPRPLYQGITVPQGFEPARMKVQLRFGIWDGRNDWNGWDARPIAAMQVEQQINDLHWMAGGNGLVGPSPAIRISAVRVVSGKDLNSYLVPQQYWGTTWVIDGGIEWGKSLRERTTGGRTYQEATFTLLGYLGIGVKAPKLSTTQTGGYFKTTQAIRTILGIASSPSGNAADPQSFAISIRKAPQNNPCAHSRLKLDRKSITSFQLPVGLKVWCPPHST